MEDLINILECTVCEQLTWLNELGLCSTCADKLERDLIRSRDWERSWTGWQTSEDQRETLRWQIISEYGATYELIEPTPAERKATSPFANRTPPDKPTPAGHYTEAEVIAGLVELLQTTPIYMWCDLQEVSQHLHQRFARFNPKDFGYKNLRQLIQAHPKTFATRWLKIPNPKQPHLLLRLTKDHTQVKAEL